MRPFFGAPSLLYNKDPIICIGQSNIAGGYIAADGYWSVQRGLAFAYNLFCHHQATVPTGAYAEQDTVGDLGPWQMGTSSAATPVSGPLVGSWLLDLGVGLKKVGFNPAILAYCIGGTSLDYWVPGASGSNYTNIIAWIRQALAQLKSPKSPIVVMYQGESGIGTQSSWAAGYATLMAQLRSDLSCANMKTVVCKVPASYMVNSITASQIAYVQSDPLSALSVDDAATYITNPGPSNLHIDYISGVRRAANVVQCCQVLAA